MKNPFSGLFRARDKPTDPGAITADAIITSKVAITGYDVEAYNRFIANNPVAVQGIVRLGNTEYGDNPSSVVSGENVKFYDLDGVEIPVSAVPTELLDASTLCVLDEDGTMHVMVTPEVTGNKEAVEAAREGLESNKSYSLAPDIGANIDLSVLDIIRAEITALKGLLDTLETDSFNDLWGLLDGRAKDSQENYIKNTCTVTLVLPDSYIPAISAVTCAEATMGIADAFGAYVRTRSKLSVSIEATGSVGSSIVAYRATLCGSTYSARTFTTGTLNTAGDNVLTVTVTDARGRTATQTQTISVLDYSPPKLTAFSAERCNADGSDVQMDGANVRITAAATVSDVNGKNSMSAVVYFRLAGTDTWETALTLEPDAYSVGETNRLLTQTFDTLRSYELKLRVTDAFYYVEQMAEVGTKQVIIDLYHDGTGIAFGKVAETPGVADFGWPLKLSEPLDMEQGGTGASTASAACTNLGAVKKTGDTMTGNLNISGNLYPSLYLLPSYNSTTNRTVFEGSYIGASSFAAWNDATGNNRRMLEVRNSAYAASMDFAVMVRACASGVWSNYRVFHAGMETPIPIANGGTGASDAKTALENMGIIYADALPEDGTDGQICLVPV